MMLLVFALSFIGFITLESLVEFLAKAAHIAKQILGRS